MCKRILKLSAFISILLLVACGQKGPLYLEDTSKAQPSDKIETLQNAVTQ